jgi:FkbM family methyltransferase
MNIPGSIRFRSDLLSRKLRGRLPGIRFSIMWQVLTTSGNDLMSAKVLEYDKQYGISLCQICQESQPLWFPVLSPEDRDGDEIWLNLLDYYHQEYIGNLVEAEDLIFDCGGYAGIFTKWALNHGAKTVVVFEPDDRCLECIRRNLAKEIMTQQVILKAAGCWSHCGHLEFSIAPSGNAGTFNSKLSKHAISTVSVPVVTLDSVAAELNVKRVDLIKMDIEGAEREALVGAQTILSRWHPELAICTYHLPDDRNIIPSIIRNANSAYGKKLKGYSGRKVNIWHYYEGENKN